LVYLIVNEDMPRAGDTRCVNETRWSEDQGGASKFPIDPTIDWANQLTASNALGPRGPASVREL
jgi:hypothetical protein